MAWTKYQLFLSILLVFTGSINTISTKWADNMEAKGRDGKERKFDHPFLQATFMFIGESLCWFAYKILYYYYKRKNDGSEDSKPLTQGNREFNPIILLIPAMCDMTGTSIMYVGLNMTYASSFQMLRGSVIVFVGILSIAFLHRVLGKREWFGIVLVLIGLSVVGIADFFSSDSGSNFDKKSIITGDLLIVIAQVVTACQMVIEEKFVAGLDIPALQAVGWEGFFGVLVLSLLQIPFYFIHVYPPFSNNSRNVLEDAIEGFVEIGNNKMLILGLGGTVVSIAFFNFAGISVTKELSATTRMVLDSIRTLFIWMFSLACFGQKFHALTLLGFVFLIAGMCLYNNITFEPLLRKCCKRRGMERLEEEKIDNKDAAGSQKA